MATKKYALERGGPKRLAVKRSWWRKTELFLDGTSLGPPIRGMDALKAGTAYKLPDGRTLAVGFQKELTAAGVTLAIDGRPVPGSVNDPRVTIRSAAKLLWFLGGINILLAAVLLSGEWLRDLGYGIGVFGLLLVALGVGAYVWHSKLAIALAIVLEVIDGFTIIALMPEGRPPPVGAIFFRVLIVVALVRAYQAVERARRLDVAEKIDQAFS